jgi:hypothetical protein
MRRCFVLLSLYPLLAAATGADWRADMQDVHEPAIDQAAARAAAVIRQLDTDAYGLADLPAVQALLEVRTLPREADALLGRWRCRSMQINALGVFVYPAFRCTISMAKDGTLEFTKVSGSQRRHGRLLANSDRSWVFMGGRSVNDDPYQSYSGATAVGDGETLEHDSVGLLESLPDGRLRMILDAAADSVELYELSP